MLHKPMKTVVFSIVLLFVAAGLAVSQGQTSGQKGQTGTTSQTQQRMPGAMGMQDQNSISATVEDVDQEENKLELRTADGETVELKVPSAVISDLQTGDRVEVSIRKQQGQSGSGTQSQPGQSGSGMQRQPGQSGRSQ